VRAFLARHAGFSAMPAGEVVQAIGERAFMFGKAARLSDEGITMTPRTTDTDGFFVALLRRT
jgi:16S rRNA (cytosine967-C5)-methyltransferase